MAATDTIEFHGIFQENLGALQDGHLKLSKQNVLFKNASTGKLHTIPLEEVDAIYWQKLGAKPGMKLALRDGVHWRFGGFKENDFNKISTFSQSKWSQPIARQENCLKGWNYGEVKFEGRNLEFDVDNKPAFEIPLSNVSHCTGTKTEAILEFHQNDDCPVQLSEMRLHIPHTQTEEGAAEQNGDAEAADPVEEFRRAVMQFADLEPEAGQPLTILQEISLVTPRGRYEIKIFQNHLSLRGKTFDYKIQMKTIQRMFLLPHKDGRQMFFAININPPIRQGLTKYNFVVIECSKDDEIELDMGGMTPEQLKEQYGGKLEPHMKGRLYEVMAKLFRILVNQKITIPGKYTGASGTPAISCALRQSSGYLYPLERGFVYVHKPPMYIRFDEIDNVNFARSDISTRSFDFEIMLKSAQPIVFSSVDKEEYNKLYDYVQEKGLKIRSATRMDKPVYKEDKFVDSDEDVDHYKEGLKADARQRKAVGGGGGGGGGMSEESEEDEDYDMEADVRRQKKEREEESSSEGSGSEPDLEYDSGDSDVSDDIAGTKSKKVSKKDKPSTSKSSGSKKSGKEKDPHAPKRPQTAFFLWQGENREKIKKPGDSITDTASRAGQMWKAMGEAEKKPYEKKAQDDKQRYEREMAEYNSKGKSSGSKSGGGGGGGGSSGSPSKKPPSSKEFIDDSDESMSSSDDGGKKAKKAGPSSSGGGASGSRKKGEPPSKKAKEQSKGKKRKEASSEEEESEGEEESDAGSTPASSEEDDD